ncbi:MAG: hypothetical protein ACOX1T_04900 [Saccharofermentanales bacterium]
MIRDVETIHVSDMLKFGNFSPVLIGTGVAPVKEVFAYLKASGFGGWLCIEEASFKGIEGYKKRLSMLKKRGMVIYKNITSQTILQRKDNSDKSIFIMRPFNC